MKLLVKSLNCPTKEYCEAKVELADQTGTLCKLKLHTHPSKVDCIDCVYFDQHEMKADCSSGEAVERHIDCIEVLIGGTTKMLTSSTKEEIIKKGECFTLAQDVLFMLNGVAMSEFKICQATALRKYIQFCIKEHALARWYMHSFIINEPDAQDRVPRKNIKTGVDEKPISENHINLSLILAGVRNNKRVLNIGSIFGLGVSEARRLFLSTVQQTMHSRQINCPSEFVQLFNFIIYSLSDAILMSLKIHKKLHQEETLYKLHTYLSISKEINDIVCCDQYCQHSNIEDEFHHTRAIQGCVSYVYFKREAQVIFKTLFNSIASACDFLGPLILKLDIKQEDLYSLPTLLDQIDNASDRFLFIDQNISVTFRSLLEELSKHCA